MSDLIRTGARPSGELMTRADEIYLHVARAYRSAGNVYNVREDEHARIARNTGRLVIFERIYFSGPPSMPSIFSAAACDHCAFYMLRRGLGNL